MGTGPSTTWSVLTKTETKSPRTTHQCFQQARVDVEPDVLPTEVVQAYRTLERESGLQALGVAGPPDADREPLDPQRAYEAWTDLDAAVSFNSGTMGALLGPLRQLSFWT